MKVGDLVNHDPKRFDDPWKCGIIIESHEDLNSTGALKQHRVYWAPQTINWTEEGLLEVSNEG